MSNGFVPCHCRSQLSSEYGSRVSSRTSSARQRSSGGMVTTCPLRRLISREFAPHKYPQRVPIPHLLNYFGEFNFSCGHNSASFAAQASYTIDTRLRIPQIQCQLRYREYTSLEGVIIHRYRDFRRNGESFTCSTATDSIAPDGDVLQVIFSFASLLPRSSTPPFFSPLQSTITLGPGDHI